MKIRKLAIATILFFTVTVSYSIEFFSLAGIINETNEFQRRKTHPFGVGLNAFGPSLAYGSVYANYFLFPCINVEAGTDIRSFYGGFNWHPLLKGKDPLVSPYVGAFVNYATDNILYELSDAPVKGFKGYFPVGVQFFTKTGFSFSAEVAYSTPEYVELSNIYWGLKIGYQFLKSKY